MQARIHKILLERYFPRRVTPELSLERLRRLGACWLKGVEGQFSWRPEVNKDTEEGNMEEAARGTPTWSSIFLLLKFKAWGVW